MSIARWDCVAFGLRILNEAEVYFFLIHIAICPAQNRSYSLNMQKKQNVSALMYTSMLYFTGKNPILRPMYLSLTTRYNSSQ